MSTRYPSRASQPPRLTAVVLFPTPPFWFAMAMTLVTRGRGALGAGVGWGSSTDVSTTIAPAEF